MSASPPQHDINADPARRARVDSASMVWQPSPSGTVWRKPFYREGGEFGPVTGVVRYAPGGRFRSHAHPAGEEILVLDGVFSDEHGDYPAGTWLLNPEGYTHAPSSEPGCDILVRLRQYPGGGRARLQVQTRTAPWRAASAAGLKLQPLYREAGFPEYVALARLAPGSVLSELCFPAEVEYFVLDGSLHVTDAELVPGGWLRLPPETPHAPSSRSGALYYLRLGRVTGGVYAPFEANLEGSW
ncbi:cupin domain-containing protein [Acidihalobacter prosperus]|uniref:ChrR-like cupin domain-containing protein n=1 Tax=Acidihalobacter prosperus TaxID=160660 RepID=A0A1A6C2J0_9GAMM|nr:cupin domain-containing protein [Acidihalobacter prosperus]OBS08765.1 hypothetical protein Thpro_023015 [Acidihalobacter prosperus]